MQEDLPGVRLIFSTKMADRYAIDEAEKVNVVTNLDDLESLISGKLKKAGCRWCRNCEFYNENGYHTDECHSSHPESHRPDCQVYCKEVPRTELPPEESAQGSEDQELHEQSGKTGDIKDGEEVGEMLDFSRMLYNLSPGMLTLLSSDLTIGTKIKIRRKSVAIKFYRKRIVGADTEIQKLKDEHAYKTASKKDRLQFKEAKKILKAEMRRMKDEMKDERKSLKKRLKIEKIKLKAEYKAKKKEYKEQKKRKKQGLDEVDDISIGEPVLTSGPSDLAERQMLEGRSLDVKFEHNQTSSNESSSDGSDIEERVSDSKIVKDDSESISASNDSISESSEYIEVSNLSCVDKLVDREDEDDKKSNQYYLEEFARVYNMTDREIPDKPVLEYKLPATGRLTSDEIIVPRKKKTVKSEKYNKPNKIKQYEHPEANKPRSNDTVDLMLSEYGIINRHVIENTT